MTTLRAYAGQIESWGINGVGLARGANAIGLRAIPLLPMQMGCFDNKIVFATLKEIGPYDSAATGMCLFRSP